MVQFKSLIKKITLHPIFNLLVSKECVNKPITLPRVTCEDIMEKKCIVVPEIMDDIEMVEKCETMLAAPKCQILELSLPKQVCVELVYGQSYEEGYHAKI